MNPWTHRAILLFFMIQMLFQTILSSRVTEEVRWNLYWIFFGMASVALLDFIIGKLRAKRTSA
ncbi:hypothetical protein LWE61_13760 [Sphingobium sufflavum]|uniref:hypothetical protein n=1 Tax=Sphingobium sufflavum TaxID=1129547 RepID=UPI001F30AC66|nr:hypothetical protein [Sphingobium sufflavum]MCE7797613.1 hypothetical protein [Sphingobium sufflavum]